MVVQARDELNAADRQVDRYVLDLPGQDNTPQSQ